MIEPTRDRRTARAPSARAPSDGEHGRHGHPMARNRKCFNHGNERVEVIIRKSSATSPAGERFDREVALLYFAHRHLATVADGPLQRFGRGRAHHRALFFVGRRPGMTVKELLAILEISYQALHRVLRDLLSDGLLEQAEDEADRRNRRLRLTAAGRALDGECAALQAAVLRQAMEQAGPGATLADLLGCLMTDGDRDLAAGLSLDRARTGREA